MFSGDAAGAGACARATEAPNNIKRATCLIIVQSPKGPRSCAADYRITIAFEERNHRGTNGRIPNVSERPYGSDANITITVVQSITNSRYRLVSVRKPQCEK